MELLNIITPVSRPQNLIAIRENIIHTVCRDFIVRWYCIYDFEKTKEIMDFPDNWIISKQHFGEKSSWGNSQRNIALDLIKEGWVYFLDDDNIIHPNFSKALNDKISSSMALGYIFSQQREGDNIFLAIESNMRAGRIDMAQVVFHRSIINSLRFSEMKYTADWLFIDKIFRTNRENIIFIPDVLCFYNKLRNPNKVLVVIIAETRGYEYSFNSFKRNLLDEYSADLCLCVADNDREQKFNPFYRNAKYVFTYGEPKDWADAFDNASKIEIGKISGWRRFLYFKGEPSCSHFLGGVYEEGGRIAGSGGILLMFRWFLKKKIQDNLLFNQYDRFVITRSDFIYDSPSIPLWALDENKIWIPDGEDYGGYTDRHIICNHKDILNILSVSDGIITNSDDLFDAMLSEMKDKRVFKRCWSLEVFLKFQFNRFGIVDKVERYPYTMYSVKHPKAHTSWSNGEFYESLGYNVKYPEEYRKSMIAKNIFQKFGKWDEYSIELLKRAL